MRAFWPMLNRARTNGIKGGIDDPPVLINPRRFIPINTQYAYDTEPVGPLDDEGYVDKEFAERILGGTEIRPPFELAWFEWTEPNEDKGMGPVDVFAIIESHPPGQVKWLPNGGILISGGWNASSLRPEMKRAPVGAVFVSPVETEWFVGDFDRPLAGWVIIPMPWGQDVIDACGSLKGFAGECGSVVFSVLWSWLLMSCGNVTLIESQPAQRRKKAHKDPTRIIHREIHVEVPPCGSRKRHVSDREDEAGVAFHIRRGHFADYTKGAGLFGKYHGRYWIPPMTVGDKSYGTVTKSYALEGGHTHESS